MELVVNAYRAAGVAAHVVNFIDDMPGAYEWADVAISRAGASSVAEISCVNRPTIFVPYPFQQGTHQTDNARVLVKRNKAFIVEETDPNFGARLKELVERLLTPSVFKEMKNAPLENPSSEAASQIAQGVLELVKSRG
jgi:UDP-N-acetylglucosamine--N-acetylmuramyl-(pentapeptide) pyrophosphoryl-undecaprenol N-acetylglucosamine transferase